MCISVVLINGWVNATGHLTTLKYFCCLKLSADGSFFPCSLLGSGWAVPHPKVSGTTVCKETASANSYLLFNRQCQTPYLEPHKSIWENMNSGQRHLTTAVFSGYYENKLIETLKSALHRLCIPIEFKEIRVSSIQAKVLLQKSSFQLGKIQLFFQSLPDRFCSSSSRFRRHYL